MPFPDPAGPLLRSLLPPPQKHTHKRPGLLCHERPFAHLASLANAAPIKGCPRLRAILAPVITPAPPQVSVWIAHPGITTTKLPLQAAEKQAELQEDERGGRALQEDCSLLMQSLRVFIIKVEK